MQTSLISLVELGPKEMRNRRRITWDLVSCSWRLVTTSESCSYQLQQMFIIRNLEDIKAGSTVPEDKETRDVKEETAPFWYLRATCPKFPRTATSVVLHGMKTNNRKSGGLNECYSFPDLKHVTHQELDELKM